MTSYNSGTVDTAGWTRNSVVSAAAGEVVLINNASSDTASEIAAGSIPTKFGAATFSVFVGAGADDIHFGIVDAALAKTTVGTNGIRGDASFCGVVIDTFNTIVRIYVGGTQVATVSGGFTRSVYETWTVKYTNSGGSLKVEAIKGGVSIVSGTGTMPSYTNCSLAVGAWSGGVAGTFKVNGTPSFTDYTLTGLNLITNLAKFEYNTAVAVTWDAAGLADGYEYRINGGTPVAVTNPRAYLTGLTNGTSYNVEVRATNSTTSTQSNWSSVLVVTPSATGYIYDDFERANVVPSTTALGAPPSGTAWTQPSGNLGILSGQAYATATAENIAYEATAYDIDVTLKTVGVLRDVGIVFRASDANNFWLWNVDSASGRYMLFWRHGGTYTTMADTTMNQVSDATMRVVAAGTLIRCFVNGVLKFEIEDEYRVTPATDLNAGFRIGTNGSKIEWVYAKAPSTTEFPDTKSGGFVAVYADGAKGPVDQKTAWVYKGRDTKALDTVGAS